MRVSIIIPNYNGMEYLRELLPSIADQTFGDYEVVVIDDCSPDRSAVEYIRTFAKDRANFRLVENTENLGFVGTCNKGIGVARGDYVCFLNQDTELKSNFVERNVEILDADASIGGLSCIILDDCGKNWWSGGCYTKLSPFNLVDDFQGLRSVDFLAGTAVFYRRDVFDKVGLFDERYVMYHEDVEFGLRIRARTDYRLCAFSDKLVTHFHSMSLRGDRVDYYLRRNEILLARSYGPKGLRRGWPRLILYIVVCLITKRAVYATLGMLLGRHSRSWRQEMCHVRTAAKATWNGLFLR